MTFVDIGHVGLLNDTTDLRFETHVEHAISLIENEVTDVGERDLATFHHVDETTRSGREKIATLVHGAELRSDIGTSVDDGGSNPGTVGELASFIVNLRDKFTSRGENESSRVGDSVASVSARSLSGRGRTGALSEEGGEDREEETSSLSGTGLGTSHQITASVDDRDGVLLDGSRSAVTSEGDVLEEVSVDRRKELGNGFRYFSSGSLDGDVGVGVEVDTSSLRVSISDFTEEVLLYTRVGSSRHVFAVLP